MTSRIEDYALIGDCQTAALVSRGGSIDWLCWPHFDSGACFAALLGSPEHGRWQIAPSAREVQITRRYRADTLILETDFETDQGAVTLVDFMPVRETVSDLIRIVVGRRGKVAMRLDLSLRFDYGSIVPWVSRLDDGALRAVAGPDMAVLRTPVELRGEGLTTVAEFTVEAGQSVPFVLTYSPSHLPAPVTINPMTALKTTEEYWKEWSSQCPDTGAWSAAVRRSLITLKALSFEPTGGIVAAPTTSLPEQPGGVRNWDYRFCWLRDATLTLLALMNANYYQEAQAWRAWLQRAIAGSPDQMQVMYSITGERRLPEWIADWLPGYEESKPVRVGNAAASQLQLDVYGEVMDALHQARKGGLTDDSESWSIQVALVNHLEQIWGEADEGMWEVRGNPRHFTFSKVMAWVALDRAVKDVEMYRLPGPLARWRRLRDAIHEDICTKAFNTNLNSFVQSYESENLDASLLLIPLMGFLPPDDPRIRGTLAAIEQHLTDDGLVRRYNTEATDDGLPPGEGRFLACSFWLADNLILQNRRQEAEALFERLLDLCNDVGLLAEEYDPQTQRATGNFPQAFSHVALINTAMNLTRSTNVTTQRAPGAGDTVEESAFDPSLQASRPEREARSA